MRRDPFIWPAATALPQFESDVLTLCRQVALQHGVVLDRVDAVTPLHIEIAVKGDSYGRGVLAMVAELVRLLRQSPQGRQVVPDLLLEPVRQDVEGPGSGGRND